MTDLIIPPAPTPPVDAISTPVTVSTPDPATTAAQGLDPKAPGLVEVLCLADACVNGVKYAKDESYLLDPTFAASQPFFKTKAK